MANLRKDSDVGNAYKANVQEMQISVLKCAACELPICGQHGIKKIAWGDC